MPLLRSNDIPFLLLSYLNPPFPTLQVQAIKSFFTSISIVSSYHAAWPLDPTSEGNLRWYVILKRARMPARQKSLVLRMKLGTKG